MARSFMQDMDLLRRCTLRENAGGPPGLWDQAARCAVRSQSFSGLDREFWDQNYMVYEAALMATIGVGAAASAREAALDNRHMRGERA